ncbi:hypothetical protein, partial [Mycobacterium colombiense]|uniref:hypothetical protein n=1 Tax=Mycobacterium colombiense TaxID=339268 RepID=UPI001E4BF42A
LVVVRTLPTPTTTDKQLAWRPGPVTAGDAKLKHVEALTHSLALPAAYRVVDIGVDGEQLWTLERQHMKLSTTRSMAGSRAASA